MSKPEGGSDWHNTLTNVLAATGLILYLFLQCSRSLIHFARIDDIIIGLTYSITMTFQIIRGLLFYINAKLPQWFLLSRFDKRLAADTTVLYLLVLALLEFFCRHLIASHEKIVTIVASELLALYFFLGATLFIISLKRSTSSIGMALAATLIFMFIFLSPLLVVAAMLYSLYHFMHLTSTREIESLSVSALIPLLVAVLILAFNDKRNRSKNTQNVIITQFCAIPFVPLCFFAMRAFWPENLSPMVLPLAIMAPLLLVNIPRRIFGKTEPWLVKEKLEILQQEMALDQQIASSANQSRAEQLATIRQELTGNKLILKKAADHLDRADAFMKLGQLQERLENFSDAELSYNDAVASYNQVLLFEPDHTEIVGRKFKTVEAISQLRRRMTADKPGE